MKKDEDAEELIKFIAENLFGIAVSQMIPHEEMCLKRTEGDGWIVDTVVCFDRDWKYETAVCKRGFRNGDWIVVAGFESEEEALKQHDIWCSIMDTDISVIHDIYEDAYYHNN